MKTAFKRLVPASWHFRLMSLKQTITRGAQTYYSQNGEDILIRSLFPAGYQGYYVDIGAHHPYRISNTYLLYKNGWHGLNVDANPETITQFKRARRTDTNVSVGVSDTAGTLTYHRFSDPAVNTFDTAHAEQFKQKSWLTYLGPITVPVVTPTQLLSQYLPHDQQIDVLSIDIEGFDERVLRAWNWTTPNHRPRVLVVESHDFTIETMDSHPLYHYLRDQEYTLTYVAKFSLIFTDTHTGSN